MAPTTIRPATRADAPAVRAIYAPVVLGTIISFENDVPSVDDVATRIDRTIPTLPWLVAEREGLVLGYAYAAPMRARPAYMWSVETSIYVDADSQGRGVGRQLYGRLLEELQSLGYVMAYAGIALPNYASVRLHQSLGFTQLGVFSSVGHKFGQWIDVAWWERALGDRPTNPQRPRRWERSGGKPTSLTSLDDPDLRGSGTPT